MTDLATLNAEANARARWWKAPEGLAYRAQLDQFYAEQKAREDQRFTTDMLILVSRIQEG